MNQNLFTKELKRNRKNLIIWSSIVLGFTLMVLSIYPYMAEMGNQMSGLMDSMPQELQRAMGMDAQTWKSILGFYSTYYGIYIVVLVSIYTTSTAANIVSKEERDRTAEFLMTRPISRYEIFITKVIDLYVLTLFIYVVQTIAAVICIQIFAQSEINWDVFITMHLNGLVLILFFTPIGLLLSMFLKPRKNFMGMVVGITFGSYFLNAIAQATDKTDWLGYITPFHYMDFHVSQPNYAVDWFAAAILLLISLGVVVGSYQKFKRKDIAA